MRCIWNSHKICASKFAVALFFYLCLIASCPFCLGKASLSNLSDDVMATLSDSKYAVYLGMNHASIWRKFKFQSLTYYYTVYSPFFLRSQIYFVWFKSLKCLFLLLCFYASEWRILMWQSIWKSRCLFFIFFMSSFLPSPFFFVVLVITTNMRKISEHNEYNINAWKNDTTNFTIISGIFKRKRDFSFLFRYLCHVKELLKNIFVFFCCAKLKDFRGFF